MDGVDLLDPPDDDNGEPELDPLELLDPPELDDEVELVLALEALDEDEDDALLLELDEEDEDDPADPQTERVVEKRREAVQEMTGRRVASMNQR